VNEGVPREKVVYFFLLQSLGREKLTSFCEGPDKEGRLVEFARCRGTTGWFAKKGRSSVPRGGHGERRPYRGCRWRGDSLGGKGALRPSGKTGDGVGTCIRGRKLASVHLKKGWTHKEKENDRVLGKGKGKPAHRNSIK